MSDGFLLRSETGTGSACPISKYSLMTVSTSGNFPLECSDRSILLKRLRACSLDSPMGAEFGFLGKGTMDHQIHDDEFGGSVLPLLALAVS